MDIPIYDNKGNQINSLLINDDLTFIGGRVSKGKNCYYKGTGTYYTGHILFDNNPKLSEYFVVGKSDIFYYGYHVQNINNLDKFGIIQERYQPQFTDFIGSCGVKETFLIENSKNCARSSVEVLDMVKYDEENDQYYFKINYLCERKKYIENNGDPYDLTDLLNYIVKDGWNFPWDKQAINDITADGRISDVADLFRSNEVSHLLGSVYSVMYSLGKLSPVLYQDLLRVNNLIHQSDMSYIFNSLWFLEKNGIDVSIMLPHKRAYDNYQYLILNYLLEGRNCGYCGMGPNKNFGDSVKHQYIEMTKKSFGI